MAHGFRTDSRSALPNLSMTVEQRTPSGRATEDTAMTAVRMHPKSLRAIAPAIGPVSQRVSR